VAKHTVAYTQFLLYICKGNFSKNGLEWLLLMRGMRKMWHTVKENVDLLLHLYFTLIGLNKHKLWS